jgi:hypothetical protein
MRCPHRKPPELGYLNDLSDAEERMKRGEKQRRCPVCVLWIWEEYYGVPEASDLTALNKRQAKEGVERLKADLKALGEIKGDGITK